MQTAGNLRHDIRYIFCASILNSSLTIRHRLILLTTLFVYQKVFEWSARDEEFGKRARIVWMARLATDDEKSRNFCQFSKLTRGDERNFIKKAVNWSFRQIGNRSLFLNQPVVETTKKVKLQNTKSARLIAGDALRELRNKKIQERLLKKLDSRR